MTKPVFKPFPRPDALLPGANFGDTYSLTVPSLGIDAVEASQRVFNQGPCWIRGLLTLRNFLVGPFGLKAGQERTIEAIPHIGIFPIINKSAEEVVLGLDDRHLDFRVLVEVRNLDTSRQEISVSTAVRTHNLLGRSYLAIVTPFHRILVPAMLMQAVSREAR